MVRESLGNLDFGPSFVSNDSLVDVFIGEVSREFPIGCAFEE